MSFINFAYISQAKLNQMYPQIPGDFRPDKKKYGAELSLGILKLKAETEQENDSASDISRLRRIVEYLSEEDELGEPSSFKRYFHGTVYAHCLFLGNRSFFFGSDISQQLTVNVGFSCSTKHMIGDYETPSASDWNRPLGLTRARYVPETSSNAGFAASLASLGMPQDDLERVERDHHDLRRDWLERFQPTLADLQAIQKRKFLNGIVQIVHHDPLSGIQFQFGNHFPPPEPRPSLRDKKLFAPLRWLLGEELYRAKIHALNQSAMYKEADQKTKVHPLAHEILTTIRFNVQHPEGDAQNYEYIAVRLLDGIVDGQRTILASPLYLALAQKD
jgi:hypothetical protein